LIYMIISWLYYLSGVQNKIKQKTYIEIKVIFKFY
jgi:hypothetical protein